MKRLLDFWAVLFYTEPIFFAILISSLVIALKHRNKFRILKLFPYYFAALLADIIISSSYIIFFNSAERLKMIPVYRFLDNLFTLFEFIVFTIFFRRVIMTKWKLRAIRFLFFGFIIVFVGFFFTDDGFPFMSRKALASTYTVQAVCLIFFCALYFHELFYNSYLKSLVNQPAFWVSTGLFFFMTFTLPYSILESLVKTDVLIKRLYALFYVSYSLMFLMISRAYLCKARD